MSSPRIFQDLAAPPRHAEPVDPARVARDSAIAAARQRGDTLAVFVVDGQTFTARVNQGGGGGGGAGRARSGPTQCHDITVYPAIGLAGGACGGYGLLLDIKDVANPRRIDAAADSNFSFWHSATFSNDGSKVLFTDEWGGGSRAALPRDGQVRVGRQRPLHHRQQQDGVQELLQDAGGADVP